MVSQNKIFSFKIKRQAKIFPSDVKRTVVKYLPNKDKLTRKISRELNEGIFNDVDAIFS